MLSRRAARSRADPSGLPPRIHRTGRTMQFNARTTPQTVEALYAIADQQGWLVGETLEHGKLQERAGAMVERRPELKPNFDEGRVAERLPLTPV